LFEKLIVTQLVNNLTTVPVPITKVYQRTVSCARKSGPPSSVTLHFFHQGEKFWNPAFSSLQSLLGSEERKPAQIIKELRTALLWVIMRPVVVISYRRFGTKCRSHLQGP